MIEIGEYTRDDDLLETVKRTGIPRAEVYAFPDVAVVLGRGSRPEVELNIENILNDGVPILRRRGGGCSVVLDPGNVIASIVVPMSGFGGSKEAFTHISNIMKDALSDVGVPGIRKVDASDLILGNRKIGGACIYRPIGLLYYSTTLLYKPNLELVSRYLRHPPREPQYRAGRSHLEFMGALADSVSLDSIVEFADRLNDEITARLESLSYWEIFKTNESEVMA